MYLHFIILSKWPAAQCDCTVSVVCYQKVVANRTSLYLPYNVLELQVRMKFGVVTEVSTFLVITQVSSGLKKSHTLIVSKYKYLHVKIASLATVKSCVTVGPIH